MVISSTQSGENDDLESRFLHLLQPIRDLTKNWDVDIAKQLEEYLDEIESIQITFDDGRTTMNFAEAALLIQGTACVYSKKVEYLYSLVYQVLDLLSSKKKLLQKASVDGEGNDDDAEFQDEREEEFLSLDDVNEHTNIDCKQGEFGTFDFVSCIPQTPMSLVQFNEKENNDSDPLLSINGDVLGCITDFKMTIADLQSDGMLLLGSALLSMNDSVFNPTSTIIADTASLLLNSNAPPMDDLEPAAADDDNDNTLVDEGRHNMSMESNHEAPDMVADAEPLEEDPPTVRRSLRQAERVLREPPPSKPRVDPWEMLDPHQPDVLAEKPLKKGRTFNIPASLEAETDAKKRKRKRAPEKPVKVESVSEFCSKNYFSHASKFPSNPLKVPAFREFERLYWIEFKRRQEIQRKERKNLAEQGRYEELAEQEQQEQLQDGAEDDNNVDFGLPDDGDHDDMMDYPVDDIMDRVAPMALEDNSQEPGLVVSSYEELVRHHVDGFLAQSKEYAQITELSRRISMWEDTIVPELSKEDEREQFDIHKYGSHVLDSIGDRKHAVSFKEVTKNTEKFSVCRLFLATLQLANTYNVKISAKEGVQESLDTMELRLLSKKRHFEELEDYRAPSITT